MCIYIHTYIHSVYIHMYAYVRTCEGFRGVLPFCENLVVFGVSAAVHLFSVSLCVGMLFFLFKDPNLDPQGVVSNMHTHT